MEINVNVRFFCREVSGDARNGEYRIPADSTVGDLIRFAAKENGTFVEDYMKFLLFMVNGKRAEENTVLKESDRVTVLRLVYGG